jgi:endonuclease/exonuclease/phosphatase family metal-dependent hydrolase
MDAGPESHELRGAVAVTVRVPGAAGGADGAGDGVVTIVGTHLNHVDPGGIRKAEIEALLADAELNLSGALQKGVPTIIAADFNMQREADHLPDEWRQIVESQKDRGSVTVDGVADRLAESGFACVFDHPDADRNWPHGAPPPPTHWTSTCVDQAWSRGLQLLGVYVVQSDTSDHLPVVTDWQL